MFKFSLLAGFLCLFLVVVSAIVLWRLPYTTSDIGYATGNSSELIAPPNPNFKIGDINWDVKMYSQAPELQPFRSYFNANCGGKTGLDAASCVADKLQRRIPFGTPKDEVFYDNYSPIEAFHEHMRGYPGHCVTYSGLESAMLLSVGIPVRLVQILPSEKAGHNVVSVWDERHGWVLFDPLSQSVLEGPNGYVSGFEAIQNPQEVRRRRIDSNSDSVGYMQTYFEDKEVLDGALVYPEPWLYTRVGTKQSPFYLRGSFVAVGKTFYSLGPAQDFFRGLLVISGFCFAIFGLLSIRNLYNLISGRNKVNVQDRLSNENNLG